MPGQGPCVDVVNPPPLPHAPPKIVSRNLSDTNAAAAASEQELGFGKCKLCVQAPVSSKITDVKTLSGKRIVTSFPSVCKKFFDQLDTPDNPTSEFFER